MNQNFWQGKRVFLTGHTGFKGAWLTIWLHSLGAKVTGYSLEPPTTPSLFVEAGVVQLLECDLRSDICSLHQLKDALIESRAEIVFHLAAQSLVIEGYDDPVETYQTNVMGTVHILEAIRSCSSVKAAIIVTTDKCYENKETDIGYTEDDRLGGYDPYSNSKACAELVTASYQSSFFSNRETTNTASVRAGNVIGGGDWADNRLIPDCIRAFSQNQAVELRYPHSVRPWQHVLEPLYGYMLLAEKLYGIEGVNYASSWNFGPQSESEIETIQVASQVASYWPSAVVSVVENSKTYVETKMLRLDSSKAENILQWVPKWHVDDAIKYTAQWYKSFNEGQNALEVSQKQIDIYQNS